MIKITSACGGDVIKFAGDALIVLWTGGPCSVLAHRACECALELQDVLHDSPMTPTIRLSLKVGVGLGPATMFYVGGHEGRCEYFASGAALRECFDACDLAASGDVIISTAILDEVRDVSCGEPMQRGFFSLLSMAKTFRKRSVNRIARPAAVLSPDALESLRSYTAPVLLSAQRLEGSLSEQSVRGWTVSVVQASVLFVNLGIGSFMDASDLDCNKIHTAVVTVQRIVAKLQGCIHRFTVDDKGCVMKLVFGAHLPHEDQPYRALLAALQIRQALSLQGIQPSVGVASGKSLIGPVGSAVRQEFTVHGDKIILAARLMQLAAKYGGMVLCDETTFLATRDDVRFVHLRPVELKGKTAAVCPYRPVASSELLEKPTMTAKPADKYCTTLEPIRRALEACTAWRLESMPKFRALVITGDHGSGKTQLLMQARARFEEGYRVLHVRCREHECEQRGALLRRIFAQLCEHDVWPSLQHVAPIFSASASDAESALIECELKLLRSHITIGEPSGQPAEKLREAKVEREADKPVLACIASGSDRCEVPQSQGPLVLIIDDVHHADAHSCELLRQLGMKAPAALLLLLSCREPRVSLSAPSEVGANELLGQFLPGHRLVHDLSSSRDILPSVITCRLRPISAVGCDELICSDLGVDKLPVKVSALLAKRSGGSPLLCQAIARNLIQRGVLQVLPELASGCRTSCKLGSMATERSLDAAATEAVVEKRHSVLCVKLAELSMLQQLILKAMSMLPEPCFQGQIQQAMPIPLDMHALVGQLRLLRERHLIVAPPSHRRSLPGVLNQASNEASYQYVDIGMREVCHHLMVESQKRQIRLRIAAVDESKAVIGSLADSISSSLDADHLARSLSPTMLRASKLRSSLRESKLLLTPPRSTAPPHNRSSHRGSLSSTSGSLLVTAGDEDKQWWLSRSLSMNSPSRLNGRHVVQPSPSRLHQRTPLPRRGDQSPHSSRLSRESSHVSSSALTHSATASILSSSLPSWARHRKHRSTNTTTGPAVSGSKAGAACPAGRLGGVDLSVAHGSTLMQVLGKWLGTIKPSVEAKADDDVAVCQQRQRGMVQALIHRLLRHPVAMIVQQTSSKVHPAFAPGGHEPAHTHSPVVVRRQLDDETDEPISPSSGSFIDSFLASSTGLLTPGRESEEVLLECYLAGPDQDDLPSPIPSAPAMSCSDDQFNAPRQFSSMPIMRPQSVIELASDEEPKGLYDTPSSQSIEQVARVAALLVEATCEHDAVVRRHVGNRRRVVRRLFDDVDADEEAHGADDQILESGQLST